LAKKKRQKIQGQFVPLEKILLESNAYKSLGKLAKIAFIYFKLDIKNGHDKRVVLTISQAKKFSVCSSPSSFIKIKRELVSNGFLDPFEPGGLSEPSSFILSDRWKNFGTINFRQVDYVTGVGYKYFRAAWKDPIKRENLKNARHKNLNTDSV
jgi:hypothetical protein